jgi:hypothetical protein
MGAGLQRALREQTVKILLSYTFDSCQHIRAGRPGRSLNGGWRFALNPVKLVKLTLAKRCVCGDDSGWGGVPRAAFI